MFRNEKIFIFQAVCVILGAIIGAGLASGREIVSFFAEYGFLSLLFLIPLFFIIFYSIKILLEHGNKNVVYVEKRKTKDLLLFICFVVFSASMLSGANGLLNQIVKNINFPLWSLLVCAFVFLCSKRGYKTLAKINSVLVSAIVVIVVSCCLFALTKFQKSPIFFEFDFKNVVWLSVSVVLYSGLNLILCVDIIKEAGRRISKKEINKISFISSLIVCFIIGLIIITLLVCDNASLFVSMPLIELSYEINNVFGVLYSIIVLFSIFTTLLATVYSSSKILERYCIGEQKSLIFSLIVSFIISLLGFQNIISFIYPIVGAYGITTIISHKFSLDSLSVPVVSSFNHGNNEIHSTSQKTK